MAGDLRCPFCEGRIVFRPCPCIRGSVEAKVLPLDDAHRMTGEMCIMLDEREPMPDDWQWVRPDWVLNYGPEGTKRGRWTRRIAPGSGAILCDFPALPGIAAHWYAAIYKDHCIVADEVILYAPDNESPDRGMVWADAKILELLPATAWDRIR